MHTNHAAIPEKIFVTGFIGSDRMSAGQKLSETLGYPLFVLDDMIEERDGRSLKKLIMKMGEHEYRNKEYEILKEYSAKKGFIMVCGDGVVHDDMNLEILKNNPTLFVEEPLEILWSRVQNTESGLYAFLYDADKETVYEKFTAFYHLRLPLYRQCSNVTPAGLFVITE